MVPFYSSQWNKLCALKMVLARVPKDHPSHFTLSIEGKIHLAQRNTVSCSDRGFVFTQKVKESWYKVSAMFTLIIILWEISLNLLDEHGSIPPIHERPRRISHEPSTVTRCLQDVTELLELEETYKAGPWWGECCNLCKRTELYTREASVKEITSIFWWNKKLYQYAMKV